MRPLRTALLILLALLMPLRGLAAATMGLEPADAQEQASHSDGGCHHGEEQPAHSDRGHACGACAEHGCCASVITGAAAAVMPPVAGNLRIALGARFAAGFVADHLDPPPLAL